MGGLISSIVFAISIIPPTNDNKLRFEWLLTFHLGVSVLIESIESKNSFELFIGLGYLMILIREELSYILLTLTENMFLGFLSCLRILLNSHFGTLVVWLHEASFLKSPLMPYINLA